MKYCSKCGKEIMDEAVICVHCGCQVSDRATQNNGQQTVNPMVEPGETNGLAIGAIVCAFLIPILGLILGIFGAAKYKTQSYKSQCITAIILSIIVWIVSAVILGSLESLFY